jgi:ABC-2 type transport system ATP-binding protein
VAIIRAGVIVEEAEPQQLVNMAVRHVHVRFQEPVDPAPLGQAPGVDLLSQRNGLHATVQVAGDMDSLIKALAHLPVADLEIERPSLEEVFLSYYEGREEESTDVG